MPNITIPLFILLSVVIITVVLVIIVITITNVISDKTHKCGTVGCFGKKKTTLQFLIREHSTISQMFNPIRVYKINRESAVDKNPYFSRDKKISLYFYRINNNYLIG